MWWLCSRLWLCWTFPTADCFPSSETPLSIALFPFFLLRTGEAVVLQRHIYWPLLASTCSPLRALACWPDGHILSFSSQRWERNSSVRISAVIYCAAESSRWMFKVSKAETHRTWFKGAIYRILSSHTAVEQKCGENLCVSVCECKVPCACAGVPDGAVVQVESWPLGFGVKIPKDSLHMYTFSFNVKSSFRQ